MMYYLQVKHNSLLTTKNGRRVRKQRIKDSKITCINLNPMHDSILVNIKHRPLTHSINQNPTSRSLCLLFHNNHSLWVRRDNAPISSHPFLPYSSKLLQFKTQNFNSKLCFNLIATNNRKSEISQTLLRI